ncbi:MAG: lysylphosphatidylglycerol synthase transmembrane domain-containing protein [Candidatus Binatia bacterium]
MKSVLRLALSFGLSAIFLYLAARGVSWEEVWTAMGEARLVYLLPMIAGSILPLCFRAWRWGVLVRPLRHVRFSSLFAATSIGFAANMLLPLRAGEVARPWALAQREGIPFAQAMATVALERLFDMAILLLLFSVATLTLPVPDDWKQYGWFFLLAFGLLFATFFFLERYPVAALQAAETFLRVFPSQASARLLGLARSFVDGLASLGSARAVVLALLHSLGVWLSIAVCFGYGLSAFSLEVPWVRAALTTTTFVAIAVSIPGGPGFIGMFQAGCVVALGVFGVPKSLAFSYSVLIHLVQFATTVALGLYFLAAAGLRVTDIRRLKEAGELVSTVDLPRKKDVGS